VLPPSSPSARFAPALRRFRRRCPNTCTERSSLPGAVQVGLEGSDPYPPLELSFLRWLELALDHARLTGLQLFRAVILPLPEVVAADFNRSNLRRAGTLVRHLQRQLGRLPLLHPREPEVVLAQLQVRLFLRLVVVARPGAVQVGRELPDLDLPL